MLGVQPPGHRGTGGFSRRTQRFWDGDQSGLRGKIRTAGRCAEYRGGPEPDGRGVACVAISRRCSAKQIGAAGARSTP